MIIGRLIAYFLIVLSLIAGLGEIVLLIAGRHGGLATADLWTLIFGPIPALSGEGHSILGLLYPMMSWPVWLVCGLAGIALYILSSLPARVRQSRRRAHAYGQRRLG